MLKLNPRSILALTATAGPPVIEDICHTLGVPLKSRETEDPTEDGTKVLSCNRDNIDVAVEFTSNDEERLAKVSTKRNIRELSSAENISSVLILILT